MDKIGTNSSIVRFRYCVGKFVHEEWILVDFCVIGGEGNWIFFCILFVRFESSTTMIRRRVVRENLTHGVDSVCDICNFNSIKMEMVDFLSRVFTRYLTDHRPDLFRGVLLLIFDTKDGQD